MRAATLIDPRGFRWTVEVPETRRERMRGLMGRTRLPAGHAVLLARTRSVHTFAMRFPILVAFLDRDLRILEVRVVPPGRLLRPRLRARHVLEAPADADLRPGDRLVERNERNQS